jgi:hypothetical protein
MSELPRPITIPEDFTVWVATDLHGEKDAFVKVLQKAGLIDEHKNWSAPAKTALVILGDIIDRGPDSPGLFRLLSRLRKKAIDLGGRVVLLEGNHEQMARDGLDFSNDYLNAWFNFGGETTVDQLGLAVDSRARRRDTRALRAALDDLAPDFRPFLYSLAPYARYHDICLVHAGWPLYVSSLWQFEHSYDRLWVRGEFYQGPDLLSPNYRVFHQAGLFRVVAGHTPVGPGFFLGGRLLILDSDNTLLDLLSFNHQATANQLTLARLPQSPEAPLSESYLLHVDKAE